MAAGNKGLEQRPLGVIEIAGVGTHIHGGAPGSSNSPHPQQRFSPKPILTQLLASSNKIAQQPLRHRAPFSSTAIWKNLGNLALRDTGMDVRNPTHLVRPGPRAVE